MDPNYDNLLMLLVAHGFSEELSKRALEAVGTKSFDALLDWIAAQRARFFNII